MSAATNATPKSFPRTAIVGQGRMGTALANAMRRAGLDVHGPLGRDADLSSAKLAVLCVPDSQIAVVAARAPGSVMLAHCSGITTLEPLTMHEAFSMHPLLTVTKDTPSFAGAGCAIHASTDRARARCLELVAALGMRPFEVTDELRPLYHAAASAASNYIVTVASYAESLAAGAGVERSLLVPLVRAAADNWAQLGDAALTGPVARGDEETVARQRRAVAAHAPESLALWDALVASTREVAARARRANHED
jgi:predicted short-subunit dehydrogenase-like oxidoreductase (DUF2520 family)